MHFLALNTELFLFKEYLITRCQQPNFANFTNKMMLRFSDPNFLIVLNPN
jgi:hypothetical protein